jgi:hypothetical protein
MSFARDSGLTLSDSSLPPFKTPSTIVCPGACNLKSTSQSTGQEGKRCSLPVAAADRRFNVALAWLSLIAVFV